MIISHFCLFIKSLKQNTLAPENLNYEADWNQALKSMLTQRSDAGFKTEVAVC